MRHHLSITPRAGTILLEFSYMFLTQREIITSNKYQKRVREFVCLLGYFVAFNLELKIIFREEGFTEILNTWVKIDKSLDDDNSVSEACRICVFCINNEQRFFINLGDQNSANVQHFIDKLMQPMKCLLYRRDHTNKSAILKLRKTG